MYQQLDHPRVVKAREQLDLALTVYRAFYSPWAFETALKYADALNTAEILFQGRLELPLVGRR